MEAVCGRRQGGRILDRNNLLFNAVPGIHDKIINGKMIIRFLLPFVSRRLGSVASPRQRISVTEAVCCSIIRFMYVSTVLSILLSAPLRSLRLSPEPSCPDHQRMLQKKAASAHDNGDDNGGRAETAGIVARSRRPFS